MSKRGNVGRIGKGRGVRESGETTKTGELEEEEVETNLDGEEDVLVLIYVEHIGALQLRLIRIEDDLVEECGGSWVGREGLGEDVKGGAGR